MYDSRSIDSTLRLILHLFQYLQICIQSCVDIPGKQSLHSGKVVFDVVCVKGVVISDSVGELDVDRRIAGLHQFQIHKQSARSAVSVDKRVDALKLYVEYG